MFTHPVASRGVSVRRARSHPEYKHAMTQFKLSTTLFASPIGCTRLARPTMINVATVVSSCVRVGVVLKPHTCSMVLPPRDEGETSLNLPHCPKPHLEPAAAAAPVTAGPAQESRSLRDRLRRVANRLPSLELPHVPVVCASHGAARSIWPSHKLLTQRTTPRRCRPHLCRRVSSPGLHSQNVLMRD